MARNHDRVSDTVLQPDAIAATHHDYVWARLPYLVPMAAKIARECRQGRDGCAELAGLVVDLRSLLLDHLDREERVLATLAREADSSFVTERITALHVEHLEIGDLLERIRPLTLLDPPEGAGACATERALHRELALLDDHVRCQILLEERVLAARFAPSPNFSPCRGPSPHSE